MATSDWYLYISQDLNYRILFPDKPKVQVKNIHTEVGEIEQATAFLISNGAAKIEFQVIVSKYSNQMFQNADVDSIKLIIQNTIAHEMMTSLNGELIYENTAELKGTPCDWFLIKYQNHLALKSCLIWDHYNLISLLHYSDYKQRLSSESDRFFNSFELLTKK